MLHECPAQPEAPTPLPHLAILARRLQLRRHLRDALVERGVRGGARLELVGEKLIDVPQVQLRGLQLI
jgi:hypothetical protein